MPGVKTADLLGPANNLEIEEVGVTILSDMKDKRSRPIPPNYFGWVEDITPLERAKLLLGHIEYSVNPELKTTDVTKLPDLSGTATMTQVDSMIDRFEILAHDIYVSNQDHQPETTPQQDLGFIALAEAS